MKKTQSVLIYLGLSIPILSLVASLTAVKAVGDDYCFASTYKNLGFLGSFNFWFFDWVPTFSFFPIHLALLLDQGGTRSFAVHSIIHFMLNSFILYLLVSLISGLSIKKKIIYTLVSWNIVIIFLGVTSPLSSKIWYATHWGLTLSHFTTAILGLLIFRTSLKDKNWKLVLVLSLWMSQLAAPEVLAWVLTSFAYVLHRNSKLTQSVKQKLIASALIQSIFSLGTIFYTKFAVAERSESFSGSEGDNKILQFLISFIRLMFHQIIDTNSLLSILVCFAVAFAIFAQIGARATLLIDTEIFLILILSTLASYIVLPAADAYAYGAPWHNLQIIVLSSLLKTALFYQILFKMAFKMGFRVTSGIRKMLFTSLCLISLSISLSLLFPNIERMNNWQGRWDGLTNVDSSLIPKTFQKQPLQGDLESEWIKECYRKWRF